MEIAICDDNRSFAHYLRELTVNYFGKIDRTCHLSIFLTPESLLNADLSITNVLFLDIEMPHTNGLDVAAQLRKLYPELLIVFVTSWIEYAPAGYRVNAFRYLLKQNLSEELSQCLNDICQKVFQTHEYIELTGLHGPIAVPLDNILYFEGTSYRKVCIHSVSSQVILCNGKLSALEEMLHEKGFLRIQRSFLVNMRHIAYIKGYKVFLKNGSYLKASERSYSKICNQFLLWKGQQI